jgi:hypothetical protein
MIGDIANFSCVLWQGDCRQRLVLITLDEEGQHGIRQGCRVFRGNVRVGIRIPVSRKGHADGCRQTLHGLIQGRIRALQFA